jgi:F0F1-type ATP synthase delta subunit
MEFKLPLSVVSAGDLARIRRELSNLDEYFISSAARRGGQPNQPPRLTRPLDQIARDNRINLLDEPHRKALVEQLTKVEQSAPVLHVSFANEPPVKIVERILAWLRENIHPLAMLQVGLQPSIAAGIVLRTPNKVFDMSLRKHLEAQRPYLSKLIKGAIDG